MDLVLTKDDELHDLVRSIVTTVLDDDTIPTWSIASAQYYTKVASILIAQDPETLRAIQDLVATLRSTYRSFLEYSHRINLISVTKEKKEMGDDVCCVCLQPIDPHWQRIVRLKSVHDDPARCAHSLHKTCALQIRPAENEEIQCPLCREPIGPFIRSWNDHEEKIPRF